MHTYVAKVAKWNHLQLAIVLTTILFIYINIRKQKWLAVFRNMYNNISYINYYNKIFIKIIIDRSRVVLYCQIKVDTYLHIYFECKYCVWRVFSVVLIRSHCVASTKWSVLYNGNVFTFKELHVKLLRYCNIYLGRCYVLVNSSHMFTHSCFRPNFRLSCS